MALGKRLARSSTALRETMEDSVARAFRKSVRDLEDNVDFQRFRHAIASGDVEEAVEACNIDQAWEPLREAHVRVFRAGGRLAMNLIAEEAERARRRGRS